MGPIDGDPSADDDQAITDTKNDLGHGLLSVPARCIKASVDEIENYAYFAHVPSVWAWNTRFSVSGASAAATVS